MKLIFIYGPPGVGKHTVGKELSKITGYKFFHNHYIADLVRSVFEWSSKPYRRIGIWIWKEVIQEVARNKINIIVTYDYAPQEKKFIKYILKTVKKNKGKVLFVQLLCQQKELYKRIQNPSRHKFSKLKKVKHLKELMKKRDLLQKVPFGETFSIDNTNISAKKCAYMIKKHYKI